MLDYNILSQKPNITVVKNGEYVTYKDLLSQTYNGNFIQGGRIVYVEKYYTARPDLISLAVYGDDKYGDIICKINGISNPFELNEGMYLYTPDLGIVSKLFTGTKIGDDILDEFKSIKPNKQFSINYNSNYKGNNTDLSADRNRKSGNTRTQETIDKQRKDLRKYKNERRSPADQTITDRNYIIDRSLGIVIY